MMKRTDNFLVRYRNLLLASGIFIVTTGMADFGGSPALSDMAQKESSGNIHAVNGSHYGAFQMSPAALQQTGYMDAHGQWTGRNGVYSHEDYMNSALAQSDSANRYMTQNWQQMTNDGTVARYNGTTMSNGLTLNEGALSQCSYVLGVGGCKAWLSNPSQEPYASQARSNNLVTRMASSSQVDYSAITGHGNTAVDNSSLSDHDVSASDTFAAMKAGCAKEVHDAMAAAAAEQINQANALAGSSATGYKMLNGKGIYDDARIGPDGRPEMSDIMGNIKGAMGNTGMAAASCLDNIVNQIGGIGAIFNRPTLSILIRNIINRACEKAQSLVANNFTNSLQSGINQINQKLYMQGNSWVPGQQFGSIGYNSGGGSYFQSRLENSDWYKAGNNATGNGLFDGGTVTLTPQQTLLSIGAIGSAR